ncbi:MAG: SBBP repeat-containing protein, partial [Candidatus Zixiibacteriota bacterium]
MAIKNVLFAVGVALCTSLSIQASDSKIDAFQSDASIPLPFTKNMGQWPDSILFRASANGATMWFTKNGIWYQFFQRVEKIDASATAVGGPAFGGIPVDSWAVPPSSGSWAVPPISGIPSAPGLVGGKFSHERDSIETTMIKAEFIGASESVEVLGLEELEYKCNYFIGNEPAKWHTDVPNYSAVTMRGVYPGVDVTLSAKDGRLQEELIASSSGDLAQVKVEYRGAESINLQGENVATVRTSLDDHTFESVLLSDGHKSNPAKSRYNEAAISSDTAVSLVYSTYLFGHGNLRGRGIAIDGGGFAYVICNTYNYSFPSGDYSPAVSVTKLDTSGSRQIYQTVFGGSADEYGNGIAVDVGGNAYVTGVTTSNDFPTQNPFQGFASGGPYPEEVFVTKLNGSGNALVYSTYLGGGGGDGGEGIAVDDAGNAYVAGQTGSTDFDTTQSAYQTLRGGFDDNDAFVTKLSSSGSELIYSTYLGGSFDEYRSGIAIDATGNAYVTGRTYSTDFPTISSFQSSRGGGSDGFITKLNSVGSALIYSTYLGGNNQDYGFGITVDASGNAYVTGTTYSTNFPTQSPFQATSGGLWDAFVTKLNSAGSGLIYSTYLGGSSTDEGHGIAVDAGGSAYLAGLTGSSNDFPTKKKLSDFMALGGGDIFVTKFYSGGSGLDYSTLFGGSDYDIGYGIAVDGLGNAYITGEAGFAQGWGSIPLLNPVWDFTLGYPSYAFVTKFGFVSEVLCPYESSIAEKRLLISAIGSISRPFYGLNKPFFSQLESNASQMVDEAEQICEGGGPYSHDDSLHLQAVARLALSEKVVKTGLEGSTTLAQSGAKGVVGWASGKILSAAIGKLASWLLEVPLIGPKIRSALVNVSLRLDFGLRRSFDAFMNQFTLVGANYPTLYNKAIHIVDKNIAEVDELILTQTASALDKGQFGPTLLDKAEKTFADVVYLDNLELLTLPAQADVLVVAQTTNFSLDDLSLSQSQVNQIQADLETNISLANNASNFAHALGEYGDYVLAFGLVVAAVAAIVASLLLPVTIPAAVAVLGSALAYIGALLSITGGVGEAGATLAANIVSAHSMNQAAYAAFGQTPPQATALFAAAPAQPSRMRSSLRNPREISDLKAYLERLKVSISNGDTLWAQYGSDSLMYYESSVRAREDKAIADFISSGQQNSSLDSTYSDMVNSYLMKSAAREFMSASFDLYAAAFATGYQDTSLTRSVLEGLDSSRAYVSQLDTLESVLYYVLDSLSISIPPSVGTGQAKIVQTGQSPIKANLLVPVINYGNSPIIGAAVTLTVDSKKVFPTTPTVDTLDIAAGDSIMVSFDFTSSSDAFAGTINVYSTS